MTAPDAPLGVLAVHAHIPVPRRARHARNGITSADDADHQVPGAESGPRGDLGHPAQRFVPNDEAVLARRRGPVLAVDNLQIGAADAVACVWTKIGPSSSGGSGMSVSATEPCRPGMTVMARMAPTLATKLIFLLAACRTLASARCEVLDSCRGSHCCGDNDGLRT